MNQRRGAQRGIQSLDAALQMLKTMAAKGEPVSLSELARDCDMPPSKVHRYLTSFLNSELVVQAGRSGKYDLGPGALRLGLAAIARHDFVNRVSEALPDLRLETGHTALLSVWGDNGPTVVRWERAASPTITSMGLGTTLPLLTSATGRAFLAWAPGEPLKAMCEAEMRVLRKRNGASSDFFPNKAGIRSLGHDIRAKGFASVDGRYIPGLIAIAGPILDWQGEAQAVVTLIGTDPGILRDDSDIVARLLAFCERQSYAPIRNPLPDDDQVSDRA